MKYDWILVFFYFKSIMYKPKLGLLWKYFYHSVLKHNIISIIVEIRCRPKDRWKLPLSLHRREGFRIQGILLPQSHPQLHVSRRRLHQPQRNWWKIHLRKQVRRRELLFEAHRSRNSLHGQRWPQHQRFTIFLVYR